MQHNSPKVDKIYTHFTDSMNKTPKCMCKYIPVIMNRLEALENVARYQQKQDKCCSQNKSNITAESLLLREKELNQRIEKQQLEQQSLKQIAMKLSKEIQVLDDFKTQNADAQPANPEELEKLQNLKENITQLISTVNKYFSIMYQQIKDQFDLPDITEDQNFYMVKGMENIVSGVVQKVNTLSTLMQKLGVNNMEQE